eukprot:XP_019918724.1 PREDICTED: uncharacterized protein LOC105318198 [Crassostrea gigas]
MAIERVENVENQKELRWQRFLKKVHEGEWGGSLEILGLSQMYNVPVTVLSVRGSRLDEVEFNHTRKTKWNPVIYIGHLRLNEIGAHFVALRPCEEKAFQQPAIFQQGEPLRKIEDNSFHCLDGQVIYEEEKLLKRIGCIKVTYTKDSHGTGFRVGSKYFMTAFHVIEDVLIKFWKEVFRRLTEKEQSHMKWTDDKIPVDGEWKLSNLLQFVGPSKMNDLMEIGKQSITDRVQIKFGFVRDNEYSFLARCSYDVAFASPSNDVVILELIEDTNLPNQFHLKTINAAATKLHLIGHPGGRKLEHDPACKIIKDQKELEKLKETGISFFTTKGYTKDQVEKDYEPCILSSDRLFFHCSKSVAHGASGSPLIVIINEKEAQVIGMLLRGHPKFYYNYDKDNGDRPDLLVESGISMEKVRSLLDHQTLQELTVNLFPEQF